ncbi:MAG: hypothetical protein V8R12_11650 [Bacteroides faecis]
MLYPEWNNRKDYKGRVKIWDTESWVGNTDDRIGLVVATNRSSGYDRSMGIFGGYMYSGEPSRSARTTTIRTEMERKPFLSYTTHGPLLPLWALYKVLSVNVNLGKYFLRMGCRG